MLLCVTVFALEIAASYRVTRKARPEGNAQNIYFLNQLEYST